MSQVPDDADVPRSSICAAATYFLGACGVEKTDRAGVSCGQRSTQPA